MTTALLFVCVLAVSALLTGAVRRYAIARSLLDIPNARSSHSVATPRGGGVAIVLATAIGLPLLSVSSSLPWPFCTGLLGAGVLVALVGFLDDHGHIAARWRLLAHFAAAAWLLYWTNGMPVLPPFGTGAASYWLFQALAAIYIVWLLNLYNFMDGIDGIASVEAISVCLGAALVYAVLGMPWLGAAPILLAAAVVGFLLWNFPPARIFMGDAGSGFLGITLAGLSIQAAWAAPELFWSWVILLGVFIVDATLTLLRRLLRGDRVYEAHRSHAYQFAARRFGRHRPVTLAVAAINMLWLFPLALFVGKGTIEEVPGAVLAYAPLVLLALKFDAGEREAPRV
jgi:Fuc2NAc and GlcNAc transferase